ncbi:hypothetical protein BBJ28_00011503 [Nothophytophthora sp. Chile5]|nr:hypothetical protein BBJ28_00011503 [Nothophytophthora sp. Chile5]
MRLAQLLPTLEVSKADVTMLQNLADTLAAHNVEQYNTLSVTKDGLADPTRWRGVRRRDGVRIYKERVGVTAQGPATPQLLLLGTVEGKLDDIMYGVVATTDEAMKIKSACTHDSVQESKVLFDIVCPTLEDPFHHTSAKWRLYESKRDYVSLDTTGIIYTSKQERIGYNISHSVAFSELPSFEATHGIERGNMSVCSLYRQKTPTTVECYVRGFFELRTQNEMLSNLALQTIVNGWASFSRKNECALIKKLAWRMRKSRGWSSSSSRTYSFADDLSDFKAPPTKPRRSCPKVLTATRCSVCRRSSRFMGSTRHTCKCCDRPVCSKCSVKQSVCALAPDQCTVLERKRTFCMQCISEAQRTSSLDIAREELLAEHHEEHKPSWDMTGGSWWDSSSSSHTYCLTGAGQRASSISSVSSIDFRNLSSRRGNFSF